MHFNAHLTVTIADKILQSLVSVNTKNDGHQLGSECDLVVPLNCRIQYKNGNHDYLTAYTKVIFKVGDPILITAYYEGYKPVTIFSGFLYEFVEGMPMTIKCMDYVYFFNLGTFGTSRVIVRKNKKSKKTVTSTGTSYKSITFKNLLQNIIDFVNDTIDDKTDNTDPVELSDPSSIPDMTLVNITFAMMSPAAILEWIKKEIGFNISLSGNKLYANLASNTTGFIIYRSDRNVLKCDIQKASATFQTFKVKAWFIREDGTRDSYEVGDTSGQLREVFFYRVKKDDALYKRLALEALVKVKQMRFNGSITTLLYPDPQMFMEADYTDIRYPDRSGNYVVTGIDTTIDSSGYRRKIKLSYLSDLNTSM